MSTAEFQKLTLIAAGVDPSQIPPVLDTATWRRLLIAAPYPPPGVIVTEAPEDGKAYMRQDGAWVEAPDPHVFTAPDGGQWRMWVNDEGIAKVTEL